LSHIKSFRTALAALVFLYACLPAISTAALAQDGQPPPRDGRYYEALAVKAYQSKVYAVFLENMKQAAALRPNHPRLMYNLSAAYALNGRKDEALEWLGRVARMGLVYAAEKDDDFASLKDSREFADVVALFQKNRSQVGDAAHAFTVHEKGLVPESVAYDPAFDEPTLGVLVKDNFYFIANSQWGALDEQGGIAPAEKLKEPVVLKLRL
jgi:tetratricopeptide (TPR) repeat protein